jgi:hypothetical protein
VESGAFTAHFTEAEIANLTVLVGMINLWNRVAIGLAMGPPTRNGPGPGTPTRTRIVVLAAALCVHGTVPLPLSSLGRLS